MAANLSEMFKNTLGDLLVSHASGSLGESAEGITSAVQSMVPLLLSSLIHKSEADKGAYQLIAFLKDNNIDGQLITNAAALLSTPAESEKLMQNGASYLAYLLGDKVTP